jgi:hypothetical protein
MDIPDFYNVHSVYLLNNNGGSALLKTVILKKLLILNSPAQTLLHFTLILIFCPGRQRIIGAIKTVDKILQFPLIPRFPAAQGAFETAPTFMHLPVFPRHSPGRHGNDRRFGLYMAAPSIPSSHRSSIKDAADLIPE